jgi:hypothetical protein
MLSSVTAHQHLAGAYCLLATCFLQVSCLAYSLILKMEACISEILLNYTVLHPRRYYYSQISLFLARTISLLQSEENIINSQNYK